MKRIMLVLLLCLLSVTGCGDRMTKVKDLRRAGITAMEAGDYAGAAEQSDDITMLAVRYSG